MGRVSDAHIEISEAIERLGDRYEAWGPDLCETRFRFPQVVDAWERGSLKQVYEYTKAVAKGTKNSELLSAANDILELVEPWLRNGK